MVINLVYSGKKAKEVAALFDDANLIDAKEAEDFEGDVVGFIAEAKGSSLPLSLEKYIETVIANRDNSGLGYIFALFIPEGPIGWAANRLNAILSDAGCVLSYYNEYNKETFKSVLEEIKKEDFKIAKNGLLYRLMRKGVKPYNDLED